MKTGQNTNICISEWVKKRPDGFYSDDIEDAEKTVNAVSRQNVLHHNLSPILSQRKKNTLSHKLVHLYNGQNTTLFSVGQIQNRYIETIWLLHSHGCTGQDVHPALRRCCHRCHLGGIILHLAAAAQTPCVDTVPGTEASQNDPEP